MPSSPSSREAADPRQLLRGINAPEAALMDPAAGLHVRFRLGGSSFPPILLYKVFTHRPITGKWVQERGMQTFSH